jgi:hypothetical protein
MIKKILLLPLLLAPSLPALSAEQMPVKVTVHHRKSTSPQSRNAINECVPIRSKTLHQISNVRLTRYYIRLGKIKNYWLQNSGMDTPQWFKQVTKCDIEADRVQTEAALRGMDLFELMTSGQYTGILGTTGYDPSPSTDTSQAMQHRVKATFSGPTP